MRPIPSSRAPATDRPGPGRGHTVPDAAQRAPAAARKQPPLAPGKRPAKVCHHEAGHAVAYWFLGGEVEYAAVYANAERRTGQKDATGRRVNR